MEDAVAIVLAAGKGTRMKSGLAKVLHPLLGRPLLHYPLEACRQAGVGRIVAVVGHQADEVGAAFRAPDLAFALQSEQKGTGHAALCSRPALEGFEGLGLILCGDVPLLRPETLVALAREHRRSGALVTVLSMCPPDPSGYGRLVRDADGRLRAIVEERDASAEEKSIREVNTGTYAVDLPWLWGALEGLGVANTQGEYYLTDVVERASGEGRAASLLLGDPEEVLGINSRAQLAEAGAILRARINRAWMEAGVTLEDPATTWIEPGVVLAEDAVVGPGCRLAGTTRVGPGCRVEQGCVVTDSELGAEVHVKPYCVLTKARVARGAQLGPFAHLRPEADVGENAHVGNFVEMKKSRLGRGSKANHLTYLGDAEVGEGANIGAGTITCNYDGVAKHRTEIGDGAFIGSNTSLVAPVRVGARAVTGAGSTITREVPEGALAVTRAPQQTLDGYADRKRRKK